MPLCGFNQKMLEGITAFNEGLFEHGLIERSKIRDQSVVTTLAHELSDMERFLQETTHINDPALRMMVEGLTLYAKGMYQKSEGMPITNYHALAAEVKSFFDGMDKMFYEKLEGKPDDMSLLVEFINTQHVGK